MNFSASPFDVSRFTVIGETLAAGLSHFSVYRDAQRWAFAAQMAKQMGVEFPQILLEPPGISFAPGFEHLPVILPNLLQSTVFDHLPPDPPAAFAVPGCTLEAAVEQRAREPFIWRDDPVQTGINLIAAARAIALGERSLPTVVEAAAARRPTLLLVELGFTEFLHAAVHSDVSMIPAREACAGHWRKLLSSFGGSTVMFLNVPDPFDCAHFMTVDDAAELLRVPAAFLLRAYDLAESDRIRVPAAHAIGGHLFERRIAALEPGGIVRASAISAIRRRLDEWNDDLRQAAGAAGAYVCDLRATMKTISSCDFNVDSTRFTGKYMGRIFGVSGMFPGRTGQALLANQILAGMNSLTGSTIPLIDIEAVARQDPHRRHTPSGGRLWSLSELDAMARRTGLASPESTRKTGPVTKPATLELSHYGEKPRPQKLQLPPGREQVLPLNSDASYFGDAISPLHCENKEEVMWGSSASHLFGGFALVDSHLRGQLLIRFSEPQGNTTRFEVSFQSGFEGEDAVLAAPVMFQMPFAENRVDGVPGTVSSGELDLVTGAVSKLRIYAKYSSSALNALVGVNPGFPKSPLSFVSSDIADPNQEYGSAWARFDQRADGKLDFTFWGTRFLPLRENTHWPLNFCGPDRQFALIPADGTVMRPHLRLSTAPVAVTASECPEIRFNSVKELTYESGHSSFGDAFLLDIPDLGGIAKGRSHVLGRLMVQFGLPCGNTVPVAMTSLGPGGLFTPAEASPITERFPGKLVPGPTGFYEYLRFPLRTYSLDELSIVDDPFDIPVGALNLRTGALLGEHLHRGFIEQDVIFSLVRVEPRTPRSAFFFRGPAIFETGQNGELRFRYRGELRIPYPKGLRFPQPNLSTTYTNITDAALEPFLWIRAAESGYPREAILEGEGKEINASVGDVFSYRFCISGDERKCLFEYENHSQRGKLRMHSLSWVTLGHSMDAAPGASYDVATFSGFAVWQKDGHTSLQPFAAHFCTNPASKYAGIQVDAGDVSNVNTKPYDENLALP